MGSKIEIDLLTVLESVDNFFELQAKNLSRLVKEGELLSGNSLFEFDSCVSIESCEDQFEFSDGKKCPGIYVFQITASINVDNPNGKFNDTLYAAKLKTEYSGKKSFHKGEVLYLGKGEKDILARINQHICMEGNTTTYSLRLNAPERHHLFGKIKVYPFSLKEEYQKYAKTIVSSVESYLHYQLNPLAGTKRS